jgi:prepilin-type N-terminal cleavage/methylation domain-containing protein
MQRKSHKIRNEKKNQGFTLIEISIVLVIVGLLLGGILQGQSLIRSMQVKDVIATIKDIQTASQYFQERYHYLPGDWRFTANEIVNVTAGGNGNGLITAAESLLVPNHLANAGLIRGDGTPIRTIYGAVRVIGRNVSNVSNLPITILNVIELANLPCEIANEIDAKLDDGNINTGNMRANVASCTVGGANDPVPFLALGL